MYYAVWREESKTTSHVDDTYDPSNEYSCAIKNPERSVIPDPPIMCPNGRCWEHYHHDHKVIHTSLTCNY